MRPLIIPVMYVFCMRLESPRLCVITSMKGLKLAIGLRACLAALDMFYIVVNAELCKVCWFLATIVPELYSSIGQHLFRLAKLPDDKLELFYAVFHRGV